MVLVIGGVRPRGAALLVVLLVATALVSRTGATSNEPSNASSSAPAMVRTASTHASVEPAAIDAVAQDGTATVIVTLDVVPTGDDAQRAAQVGEAIDEVLAMMPAGSHRGDVGGFTVPTVPLVVDAAGLDALAHADGVRSVRASRRFHLLASTGDVAARTVAPSSTAATWSVGAPTAWAAGRRGAGATVAVIDTGVDVHHPFLTATPRNVWEGCFGTTTGSFVSPCPGGVPMTADSDPVPGSAAPCAPLVDGCGHGTFVAGVALGGTGRLDQTVSGIAPAAGLVGVSIMVADPVTGEITADEADIIRALQWVYNQRGLFDGLAAVNLSFAVDGPFPAACDGQSLAPVIDQLSSVGVAVVAAAGNDGDKSGVTSPACISSALAVGATDDLTGLDTDWSDIGPQVAIVAPGADICSSVPSVVGVGDCPAPDGGTMQYSSGTSFSAPAVAGAVALLKAEGIAFSEWRSRLQLVAAGSDCVQAAAYAVPSLRVDVALGLPGAPPSDAPCAPSAPAASLVDATSAAVSWIAPASVGTGTLVSYTATATTGQSCTVAAPATTCTVTGLAVGGTVRFTVTATSTTGTSGPSIASNAVAEMFHPVEPARIADTRPPAAGGSTIDGQYLGRGPVMGESVYSIQVLGRGGIPASGVVAVALNVTATNPTDASYLTVFPSHTARPTASNLNVVAGATVPNLVLTGVGGGFVSVFNAVGSVDVVVDVVGWYASGGGFEPVWPARLVDTRPGQPTVGPWSGPQVPLGPGAVASYVVVGRGGVPVDAGAVALNVTVTDPTAAGYLTVFPTGSSRPLASNLNFVPGRTVANAVLATVGDGGRIDVYNDAGTTDVVIDVVGWMPSAGRFHGMDPARLVDTRPGGTTIDGRVAGVGPLGQGGSLSVPVVGRAGIPVGASAVVVNVTATEPTGTGFLTVFPAGAVRPTASNLNVVPGLTVPNLVLAGLGEDGRIVVFNSAGSTQIVVDVVGWYA